ncbi:MAG: general secretion pathway protein GspB [Gammaproteobacteria bacterium]|nr:general secretion pathway protein GspB [Gammaproteobacteria bacterium]
MSFILDALRKSETERQRQNGPGLIDAGYRPPAARRSPWIPLLVAVLVANLAIMGFLFLRKPAGTTQAVASAPQEERVVQETTPAVVAPASAPPAEEADDDAYAAIAALPALEPEDGYEDANGVGQTPPAPPAAASVPPEAVQPASRIISEGLPSVETLVAEGSLNLPEMRLDMHVFAPGPDGRFVFINMRKYVEGEQLDEGPRLEEITRDGVILSLDGRRFVLNR